MKPFADGIHEDQRGYDEEEFNMVCHTSHDKKKCETTNKGKGKNKDDVYTEKSKSGGRKIFIRNEKIEKHDPQDIREGGFINDEFFFFVLQRSHRRNSNRGTNHAKWNGIEKTEIKCMASEVIKYKCYSN